MTLAKSKEIASFETVKIRQNHNWLKRLKNCFFQAKKTRSFNIIVVCLGHKTFSVGNFVLSGLYILINFFSGSNNLFSVFSLPDVGGAYRWDFIVLNPFSWLVGKWLKIKFPALVVSALCGGNNSLLNSKCCFLHKNLEIVIQSVEKWLYFYINNWSAHKMNAVQERSRVKLYTWNKLLCSF